MLAILIDKKGFRKETYIPAYTPEYSLASYFQHKRVFDEGMDWSMLAPVRGESTRFLAEGKPIELAGEMVQVFREQ